jgi:hypothetical protein
LFAVVRLAVEHVHLDCNDIGRVAGERPWRAAQYRVRSGHSTNTERSFMFSPTTRQDGDRRRPDATPSRRRGTGLRDIVAYVEDPCGA